MPVRARQRAEPPDESEPDERVLEALPTVRAHGGMGCGAVGRVPAAVVFSPSSVAVALALTSASDDA